MTQNEFSKQMLRGETPIDSAALADRIVRRDRRRMWILGILCVIAWMLVVMLPWSTVLPMMAKVGQHQMELDNANPTMTPQQREVAMRMADTLRVGTIATFIGSLSSMFVAAICTVGLILLSRRATLRQVNARLAEISNQLKGISGQR